MLRRLTAVWKSVSCLFAIINENITAMAQFTFDGTIIERWGGEKPQVLVRPDDEEGFVRQCDEMGVTSRHDWYDDRPMPTIGRQDLVARCEGAKRVRCTIEATQTGRIRWLGVEPID